MYKKILVFICGGVLVSETVNSQVVSVEDKTNLLSYMSDSDSEDIDIISYNIWIKENIK